MKTILILSFVVSSFLFSSAFAQEVSEELVREWVMESIQEMPVKGGYELTRRAPEKLRDSFSWNMDELLVNEKVAIPSYCTTATFIVFYKVLQKYWDYSRTQPNRTVLEIIKPNMDSDGVRIWGRWNSNGPATAKFFFETGLGENFDRIEDARPGDFLKLFWNGEIGKLERGHSVVYLGTEVQGGVRMVKFWGSNKATDGYGIRTIPMSDAKFLLFSRLKFPENAANIASLPVTDTFLASMLTKVSNWTEVRKVTGIQTLW